MCNLTTELYSIDGISDRMVLSDYCLGILVYRIRILDGIRILETYWISQIEFLSIIIFLKVEVRGD